MARSGASGEFVTRCGSWMTPLQRGQLILPLLTRDGGDVVWLDFTPQAGHVLL